MSVTTSRATSTSTRAALRSADPVRHDIARGTEQRDQMIAAARADGYVARASKFNNGTSYPCFIVRVYEK